MGLALRRIKVYCKLGLIGAIVIVLVLVVSLNRNNTADVWFFRTYQDLNVLYLMVVTGIGSIVAFWTATRIRGVLKEAREVREAQREAERTAEQKKLADELATREKRLDEKLRRSITEES